MDGFPLHVLLACVERNKGESLCGGEIIYTETCEIIGDQICERGLLQYIDINAVQFNDFDDKYLNRRTAMNGGT